MSIRLTDRQRREIRFKYAAGHGTYQQLADQYGVSMHCVQYTIDRGHRSRERIKQRERFESRPEHAREKWRDRGRRRPHTLGRQLQVAVSNASRKGIAPPESSPEALQQMKAEQRNCCAICGAHEAELPRRLCIDHCHKTGLVRGFLCDRCNKMLGCAVDCPVILQEAIKYLRTP